jgi:hypothetical protein
VTCSAAHGWRDRLRYFPVGGDRDADDPVVEDVMRHVRELRAAVAADGRQHGLAGGTSEVDRLGKLHAAPNRSRL